MASLSIARADALGPARFAFRVGWLVAALIVTAPLHYLWKAFVRSSPWPRIFLGWAARASGAVVATTGERLRRDVFYVANHLSWIDIPIMGGASGTAFVSQDKIAKWPVVGWLAALNNTVFVSRTDRLGVSAQIETLRAALAEHQPITIFPEGTTTDGRSLLPFKPSLFAVMAPPPRNIMVQPVLIDFGDAGPDIAWIGEETAPDNARRLLSRRGTFAVRVEFLEPFDPAPLADRKAIAAEARNRIRSALSASLGGAVIV